MLLQLLLNGRKGERSPDWMTTSASVIPLSTARSDNMSESSTERSSSESSAVRNGVITGSTGLDPAVAEEMNRNKKYLILIIFLHVGS